MGIPIDRYIDVSASVLPISDGRREFGGLVFLNDEMLSDSSKKADYDAGEPITLSEDEISECFGSSTSAQKFATEYFGYSNIIGDSPIALTFVKADPSSSTTSASTYFSDAVDEFSNFGSFAFIGNWSISSLLEVASTNEGYGMQYAMVVLASTTNADDISQAMKGKKGVHIVLGNDYLAMAMPMAWVGSHNYDKANASGTIDYKEGGSDSVAVVSSGEKKDTYDKHRVNYIGQVQARGIDRKFYQTGVNADGQDLGVYVDSAWIQSQIEAGWFTLACGTNRVPANDSGVMLVRGIILGVAERAIANGCILSDKPLTDVQKTLIDQYAGVVGASESVSSVGYYVSVKLVTEAASGKYVVQYTLIYAKGDHISKVSGSHYLA